MQTMLELKLDSISKKDENIESLFKELAEDKYKYDLRFWPDNKISLESIKKIADKELDVMCHRIDYVIKKIIKSGGSPEQIYEVMVENKEEKIKQLLEHCWQELNDFYKTILQSRILSKKLNEIAEWGRHTSQCYQEYKMFCEHIGQTPQPEPRFIEQGRQMYLKLKKERR